MYSNSNTAYKNKNVLRLKFDPSMQHVKFKAQKGPKPHSNSCNLVDSSKDVHSIAR